jgi:hypothetical protein
MQEGCCHPVDTLGQLCHWKRHYTERGTIYRKYLIIAWKLDTFCSAKEKGRIPWLNYCVAISATKAHMWNDDIHTWKKTLQFTSLHNKSTRGGCNPFLSDKDYCPQTTIEWVGRGHSFFLLLKFLLFIYSHVRTLFGSSPPPSPPPAPSCSPSLPLPPPFQAEPVLPLSLILLKRGHKHNKKDKVFLLVKDSYIERFQHCFHVQMCYNPSWFISNWSLHWFLSPFSCWPLLL